jgi:type IV secretory pathway ATPase VirB11/archaellum biosynthesis ATPase
LPLFSLPSSMSLSSSLSLSLSMREELHAGYDQKSGRLLVGELRGDLEQLSEDLSMNERVVVRQDRPL